MLQRTTLLLEDAGLFSQDTTILLYQHVASLCEVKKMIRYYVELSDEERRHPFAKKQIQDMVARAATIEQEIIERNISLETH
jgi:hypothetical protein